MHFIFYFSINIKKNEINYKNKRCLYMDKYTNIFINLNRNENPCCFFLSLFDDKLIDFNYNGDYDCHWRHMIFGSIQSNYICLNKT